MSESRFARLEVREADYQHNKELQELMAGYGEETLDPYEGKVRETASCDASYGEFEELEDFCVNNDIAFDRFSEESIEQNARMRIFRPGSDPIDKTVDVDVNMEPFVPCNEIFEVLKISLPHDITVNTIRLLMKEHGYPCDNIRLFRSKVEQEK